MELEEIVRVRVKDLEIQVNNVLESNPEYMEQLKNDLFQFVPSEIVRNYRQVKNLYDFNNKLLLKIGKAPNMEQ